MTQNKFRLNLVLMFFGLFIASNNTAFGMKAKAKKPTKKVYNHEHKKPATFITLVQGDITQQEFDDPNAALVNAANERLIGGAGVAAAIQNEGGAEIMAAIRSVDTEWVNGVQIRRNVGGTVLTTSGAMAERDDDTRVDWVIHAVGPDLTGRINRSVSRRNQNNKKKQYLRCTYRNILHRAFNNDITTVALTAISTNIFGYDIHLATPVAINAVVEWLEEYEDAGFREIRFVVYGRAAYDVYREALEDLVGNGRLQMGKAVRIANSPRPKLRFILAH